MITRSLYPQRWADGKKHHPGYGRIALVSDLTEFDEWGIWGNVLSLLRDQRINRTRYFKLPFDHAVSVVTRTPFPAQFPLTRLKEIRLSANDIEQARPSFIWQSLDRYFWASMTHRFAFEVSPKVYARLQDLFA